MKILFVGDVVGSSGRKILKERLPQIKSEHSINFVIVNGENAAGGSGITHVIAQEFYSFGVDVITLGNHTWSKREVLNFIDFDNKIIRPANFSYGVPGKGSVVIDSKGVKVGLLNLIGRVYMEPAECPFRTADIELEKIKKETKIIIVDIHAEATSEKCALAYYLDGRVGAVLGTHTHVQTADERILPCGTGFITDVGMTGPYESIIGVDKDIVLRKFCMQMPVKFEVAQGKAQLNAVILDIDEVTGRCAEIQRIWLM